MRRVKKKAGGVHEPLSSTLPLDHQAAYARNKIFFFLFPFWFLIDLFMRFFSCKQIGQRTCR